MSKIILTLESVPSEVPVVIRVRRLLKALLRAYGFRVKALECLDEAIKVDEEARAVQTPAPDRKDAP